MVLNELGGRLSGALQKMMRQRALTDEVLDELVAEVSAALEASDVPAEVLAGMRERVARGLREDPSLARPAGSQPPQGQAALRAQQQAAQRLVVQEIVRLVQPEAAPYQLRRGKPNVIMFVGLQGAGKTTTCAKYALYHKRRGWKVGLVCCDTYRAGAFEQLKQNCAAVHVPFYGSAVEKDPARIAEDGVAYFRGLGFDLIVLDTSGRHRQAAALFEEMAEIARRVSPSDVVFTMDSSIGQAAMEQADSFRRAVPVGSVIVTKMDGHARGGGCLAAVAATGAPIIFVGSGERFEDFEPFEAGRFVSRLLGYGDMQGLMEAARQAQVSPEKQLQAASKMLKGEWSFRDLRDQLEAVSRMGPLDKLLELLPGGAQLREAADAEGDMDLIPKMLVIMNSMSRDELESNPEALARAGGLEGRVRRLALGSGFPCALVRQFFEQAQLMNRTFGRMGKAARDPARLQGMLRGMGMGEQLQGLMAGGVQGLMSAGGARAGMPGASGMAGMAGAGGAPDLSALAGLAKAAGLPGAGRITPQQLAQAQRALQGGAGAGGMPLPGGMGGLAGITPAQMAQLRRMAKQK